MNDFAGEPTFCSCGMVLTQGPEDGDSFWCEREAKSWDPDVLLRLTKWRGLSLQARREEFRRIGVGIIDEYGVTNAQMEDLAVSEKEETATTLMSADVAPRKEVLPNLARGLDDLGALREMIDNAIDSSEMKSKGRKVTVTIVFDARDGVVRIRDDAGGMDANDLLRCLRLGSRRPDGEQGNVIGRFGVGAKEAIYHFGREVVITSRLVSGPGLRLEVTEEWLNRPDWNVDVKANDLALEGQTEFRIGSLNHFNFDIDSIQAGLGDTYGRMIRTGRLAILLNDSVIQGAHEPEVLYPPELFPRTYRIEIRHVIVTISIAMLRKAAASSGVFFYVFGRRYDHWLWNDQSAKLLLPKSPPQSRLATHFRLEIDFSGPIDFIPITANKDGVAINRPIFKQLEKVVWRIVQPYLSTVTWLSQDKNMGYVNRFTRDAAHATAQMKFEREYRFSESSQMPKEIIADESKLYSIVKAERSKEEFAVGTVSSGNLASDTQELLNSVSTEERHPASVVQLAPAQSAGSEAIPAPSGASPSPDIPAPTSNPPSPQLDLTPIGESTSANASTRVSPIVYERKRADTGELKSAIPAEQLVHLKLTIKANNGSQVELLRSRFDEIARELHVTLEYDSA